jgi:Mrp family chromosome partitioning ATPase
MAQLSSKYDRILIDSPPIVPFTDACVFAAICDATLLVLRAEKSTRKDLQQARDALLGVGAHILGAVANDVPRRNGEYGHNYYGHYHGYRYRREEKERENQPVLDVNVTANPRNDVRIG